MVVNPYYVMDRQISKMMNQITDLDQIAKPVHKKIKEDDMSTLRAYTMDMLEEISINKSLNSELLNRNVSKNIKHYSRKLTSTTCT